MPRQAKASDPLATMFARRRINGAQLAAGQEFRKAHGEALAKCHLELGQEGAAIAGDALIRGLSARQLTELRGRSGTLWERYYSRRLQECLSTLSEVFGFAGEAVRPSSPVSATLRRGRPPAPPSAAGSSIPGETI